MTDAPAMPDLEAMIVRQDGPFNAEPRPEALIAAPITPQSIFYGRSHGAVPSLNANQAIAVAKRTWTRAALERGFPVRSVEATLQCAGNR